MAKKEPTLVEYETAESGFVTLYNFKLPTMPFQGYLGKPGFGFAGTLMLDADKDKIQCHLCGKWEQNTLSNHIKKEHAMNVAQYKKIVGLRNTTALITEQYRDKLIAMNHEKRLLNLKPQKMTEETKAKIRATRSENTMEEKNQNGTCPAQLLERLKEMSRKNDGGAPIFGSHARTPGINSQFVANLKKAFGSTEAACRMAGVPFNGNGIGRWLKQEKERVEYFVDFYKRESRFPNNKELQAKYPVGFLYDKRGGKTKIEKEARRILEIHKPYQQNTRDELLKYLNSFFELWGREPSPSDCRRGLLPSVDTYYKEFGSWKEAKELALSIR